MTNLFSKKIFFNCLVITAIHLVGCNKLIEGKELENTKYASYCGQEVAVFLEGISSENVSDHTWSSDPPGMFYSVFVKGKDGKIFEIFVEELKFQNKFNPEINWSFELFRKEEFRGVIIWDGREKVFQYFCTKSL